MTRRLLGLTLLLLAPAGALAQKSPKPAPAPAPAPAKPAPAAPKAPSVHPAWKSAVDYFTQQDQTGNWTKATCENAAKKFADAGSQMKSADAYFNAGASWSKCRQWDDAKNMYDKALTIVPDHASSLGGLGEIALRQGREADAQRYFERAVDFKNNSSPWVTGARNNLAVLYYRKIRLTTDANARKQLEEKAFDQLQRTLATDSDNVFAYTLMAMIYLEGAERNKSRLNLAQILLDQGKKRNDKYPPMWNAYGLLRMARGQVSSAIKDFRQAVQLDGSLVEARMNLAQILVSGRNYAEAEQHFREVLKLQPKNYDAMIGLGVSLRGAATVMRVQGAMPESQAKIDEAEKTYNAALQLDPKKGDAYYNLGLIYKDYRTNDADLKKQIEGFRKAKNYFNDYLARADKASAKRREAEANISSCDANIDALNQAIQIQSSSPAPTPTAPAPNNP
jgi:tetratricopeptide (TPR) repeat protein